MSDRYIGAGGFYTPVIYSRDQSSVEASLLDGDIDRAELSQWSFADEFLAFINQAKLLEFIDRTFPNPREKNEVPIWFLVSCQFLMRIYQTGKYQHLKYLLNSGSILTRTGFNVGSRSIGFNDKNKKARSTAVDFDTVRKFFKDIPSEKICDWYSIQAQGWFRSQKVFDAKGLFILDQSRLVVPDNPNYSGAVKMPVDEHGQLYKNLKKLTNEQKRALIYHPCYSLSTLLHVDISDDLFHVASYKLGPGNDDELTHARTMVPAFCYKFPGLVKDLILDRGYVDGEFIDKLKRDHDVSVLLPLKSHMHSHRDAIDIAVRENAWIIVEEQKREDNNFLLFRRKVTAVNDMDLWDSCKTKHDTFVSHDLYWDAKTETYEEHFFVLGSTRRYSDPRVAIARYKLRAKIEERFRQFKRDWYISEFPSPNESLLESHVAFTLLTYSLLQFYLRRKDLRNQTNKMMTSLKMQERLGNDSVIIYSGPSYAVLNLDDYTSKIAGMDEGPRQKLKILMEEQKKQRLNQTPV